MRRRAGAGANAGYGTSREVKALLAWTTVTAAQTIVHSWRRRYALYIRSQVTRRVQCA
ncbi:hypothetical protein KCP76_17755 [Salmonella enterica subsp. enterica serovar Weltevreden]|nr:hypothetical protein KCP76_17755 [Salmonella enterica subsp. enterica serovar Weltevreden]